MTMNRAERRAMKHKAGDVAAKLASRCYDFQAAALVPVTDSQAITALICARAGRHNPVLSQLSQMSQGGWR